MSSPKINKMILELEDSLSRSYEWKENKLTMAELVTMLQILNKPPEVTNWIEESP